MMSRATKKTTSSRGGKKKTSKVAEILTVVPLGKHQAPKKKSSKVAEILTVVPLGKHQATKEFFQGTPIRDFGRGYYRSDQPLSVEGKKRYRVLVETELQRVVSAYGQTGNPRPPMKVLKKRAQEKVYEEAFEHSRAPFGRMKGVSYSYDQKSGVVEFAGAVFTLQTPEDKIRPCDLKAQADARFENGGRRLSFTPKTRPRTLQELRRIIERQTFIQGVSGDGRMAQVYLAERERDHRTTEGKLLRERADKDPRVLKKRKDRAGKKEYEAAKKSASKRAVTIVESARKEAAKKKQKKNKKTKD